MLNLSIRNLLLQKHDGGHGRVRRMSAERRLDLGPGRRQRPKVQKSLFGFIFAAKEDITGIDTLPQARRNDLYRRGVWDGLSPELERWLRKWRRGGGIAIL